MIAIIQRLCIAQPAGHTLFPCSHPLMLVVFPSSLYVFLFYFPPSSFHLVQPYTFPLPLSIALFWCFLSASFLHLQINLHTGGLSLQDLTASSLRVDAALLGLSASSHRVDAALLDLSASSNRVDAALIQLIGYNQNRDRQPEVMCVRGLWVYLEGADGWQVIQELGNFNIYYTSGRNQGTCAAEWDGGVVASDGSGRKHIFLVDSSSTMDVGKVNSCRERFARTIKHTASTVTVGIPAQHATQRLLQQLRRQPSCARLHCYIGGVVIESDAMNRAQTLNYGVIQQHDDKFEVVKFVDR
eukprot:gene23608-30612_t